jgi:uncharacterized protein
MDDAEPAPPTHAGPTAATQTPVVPIAARSGARISSLDFIRGLAVMGILAANIIAFGQPFNAYIYPGAFLTEHGAAEGWMYVAQFVLIDGKMRGLFTLLFGAGLYLFMENAWAKGQGRGLQLRRLVWLLVFGLIHFYLIWPGDILTYYALAGFLVLLCVKWDALNQLKLGLLGYFVGALVMGAIMTVPWAVADTGFGESEVFDEMHVDLDLGISEALADDAAQTQFQQAGDYAGLIAYRFEAHWYEPFVNFLMFGFETVPLMLIGIALYRIGFFSGGIDVAKMRKWGWVGLIGGGLVSLAMALFIQSDGFTFYGSLAGLMGWSYLPRLAMALGLAALLVAYTPAGGWLGDRVKAAGRVAFTNYLGTSLVMMVVFQGWAGGLFGLLTRGELYLVWAAMCIIMLLWSKPWLDRFRYGPLEWLWRCLTYGRLFPLKR